MNDVIAVFSELIMLCYSPPETRNFLLTAIAFSGAAAVGISYTTAWCVRVTSSTTYRYVLLAVVQGDRIDLSLVQHGRSVE